MSLLSFSALALAVAANVAANILTKKAAGFGQGLALYFNPWFIGGVVLFALNLVAYTFALKAIPLSLAYPLVIGGTLVGIAVFAAFGLGEPLSPTRIGGIALILLGATLVVR